MPDHPYRVLLQAASQEEAQYVAIMSGYKGCKVTEGQVYRLLRNHNNPQLFEHGEAYVVDDDTKDNYSVFLLCRTALYK
ncbi:hypothetical protein [Paenibacillus donghaensis]|uniref:Uncharacterized protein n=1 Tax=Paenibacillus donghaensis TaxID=414771 RepID=A0A2Z2KQJ1_9BACL|nr:hypothetical protein [Paenibacillus donghaensis]ASA23652.1 hypothetical protein B9T62_24375 [Paenibacillus donghaensis]